VRKPKPHTPEGAAFLAQAIQALAITRQELGPASSITRAHLLVVIADREPATFAEVWDATCGVPEPTMENLESLCAVCAVDASGRQGAGVRRRDQGPGKPAQRAPHVHPGRTRSR
jgi:hypothetical protein